MSSHSRGSSDSSYSLDALEADAPKLRPQGAPKSVDNLRNCRDCGQPARIVSNSNGLRAFCGPCKKDWAISMSTRTPVTVPLQGRGVGKSVVAEQSNYELAYEDLDDEDVFKRVDEE